VVIVKGAALCKFSEESAASVHNALTRKYFKILVAQRQTAKFCACECNNVILAKTYLL
jgi:hypothetical protein